MQLTTLAFFTFHVTLSPSIPSPAVTGGQNSALLRLNYIGTAKHGSWDNAQGFRWPIHFCASICGGGRQG